MISDKHFYSSSQATRSSFFQALKLFCFVCNCGILLVHYVQNLHRTWINNLIENSEHQILVERNFRTAKCTRPCNAACKWVTVSPDNHELLIHFLLVVHPCAYNNDERVIFGFLEKRTKWYCACVFYIIRQSNNTRLGGQRFVPFVQTKNGLQ